MLSRRDFLRGNFSKRKPATPRPPWALAEPAFIDACTRCGDCVRACPERIIVEDAEGRPTVSFAVTACTFCGKCEEVCEPHALRREEGAAPWQIKAEILDNCIAKQHVVCRTCGDACPTFAIRFRPQVMDAAQPEVDPEICTGCGACVAPCPAQAIRIA